MLKVTERGQQSLDNIQLQLFSPKPNRHSNQTMADTYTLDLSMITYVIHWLILIYFCRKPLYNLIQFTFGIFFVAFAYVFTGANYGEVTNNYTWFDYAKRLSLILGFCAYVLVYYKNSKASRIFIQWILAINVFEAGLFSCQQLEISTGILLILTAPFSPQIYVNEERTLTAKPGNLLQRDRFNYLSVKWYMRAYLIIIGVWSFTTKEFNRSCGSLYAFLTCLLPLLLDEYFYNNFMNHFSVRTFSLFIATAIDGSFDTKWVNKQPQIIPNDFNIIWRNAAQIAMLIVSFGLVVLNDRFRGNRLEKKVSQHHEQQPSDSVDNGAGSEDVGLINEV